MPRDTLTHTLQTASVGAEDLALVDLLSLASAAAGAADATDTLRRLTRVVSGRLDASACACLLVDLGGDTRDLVYACDAQHPALRGQRLPATEQSYELRAVLERAGTWGRGGSATRGPRSETPPVFRGPLSESSAHERSAVAGLLVPLVCAGHVVGVFFVGARRNGEAFDDPALALVQIASALLGQAAAALVRERELLDRAREDADQTSRQFEKLETANAKLRRLIEGRDRDLSILAHDMRSPIGVILGHVSVLQRLLDGPREGQCLGAIRRQGARLQAMLEDVVGDKRRRAQALRLEPVDLGPWFTNRAHDFSFLAQNGGVQLEVEMAPELGIRHIDSEKLEEVLGNLLDNAIKYSGPGGSVKLEVGMSGDETLSVSVSDSGPGLSAEALEKGFELWFRDDSTRRVAGTGIGLASVLELVELMEGRVEAYNRSEGGACFSVVVPAHLDELVTGDTNPMPVQRFRVLLVDGGSGALGELREALRGHFETLSAKNEHDALWLARQGPVDCAIIDLGGPERAGFDTAASLRSDPDLTHLPVLFTVSEDLESVPPAGPQGAFDDVVTKPVSAQDLVARVSSVIAESVRRSALVRAGRTD